MKKKFREITLKTHTVRKRGNLSSSHLSYKTTRTENYRKKCTIRFHIYYHQTVVLKINQLSILPLSAAK